MNHHSFLQKLRSKVTETDCSIEQYVQNFIEQVDEVFNNCESER